ncbi:MAG: GTP-binding protein [Planctomycetes bacterium]|nr:GTP-binding protein [Planctomycetota bacterium]
MDDANNAPRTLITRLTSTVPAAIAVVEVDGPMAVSLVQKHWRPNTGSSELQVDQIRYGVFRVDTESNDQTDLNDPGESIVVHRSDEHRVELHCHGGNIAAQRIIHSLIQHGATQSSPAEWIDRRSNDDFQAEATKALLKATTLRTTMILMDQWRGSLCTAFKTIEEHLQHQRFVEANNLIAALQQHAELGIHLVQPWKVVLCGPPNVGKSSLLNCLLGYTRAIVHEQAGTTRDILAESTSIDGWPVALIDSAGIRPTNDQIEHAGIQRAVQAIQGADRVLLLVDPVQGWCREHAEILHSVGESKTIVVQTKADIVDQRASSIPHQFPVTMVSNTEKKGFDRLLETISRSLVPSPPLPGKPMPFCSRHLQLLYALLEHSDTQIPKG